MRKIPPVNAVRAFEVASRHLQFQSAADEMGITPSALSYQIRQLEEFLGIKLFIRMNRAVELTREGKLLSPGIVKAFDQLEETFALLGANKEDNTLTISSGPAFSAKWLVPRLHSFLEAYPEIDFRLSANLKLTDFERDDVDAVIRFGEGNYPGVYVEPLFDEISTPLISPKLFAETGGKADESLFQSVKLIHDESLQFLNEDPWVKWLSVMGYEQVNPKGGVRFNHADYCIEAAADGGGIVMARVGYAFREIESGRLIAPFKQTISAKGGFYFCCPYTSMENRKVLDFLAWIRDEVEDQSHAFNAFMKDRILL